MTEVSGVRRWGSLILSIGLCLAASAIGALATASSVRDWYPSLNRPSWNPPDSVFGPVWTLLFVMMGVALWLVWQRRDQPGASVALGLFGLQLTLNVLWSVLFFGMRRPDLAFAEILVLWLAIAATSWAFKRHSKLAAGLLLPYLAWVSFASLLNFTIWRLN